MGGAEGGGWGVEVGTGTGVMGVGVGAWEGGGQYGLMVVPCENMEKGYNTLMRMHIIRITVQREGYDTS